MPVPDVEAAPAPPPTISNHRAHPGRKLKRVADGGEFFICGGCKEPDAGGVRYRCEQEGCDFTMHTCCAVPPDTLTHPEFGDRVFVFLQEPPEPPRAGTGARSCAVCVENVHGFVYHCFDDGIVLHPPCFALLAPEHAIVLNNKGPVSALSKEVADASRRRGTSDDDDDKDHSRRKVHLPSLARHRCPWDGRQAGKREPPPAETTQPTTNQVVEVRVRRQEVSPPGDAPCDTRNREREREPPVSRYRTRKR